jgi:hypothetical protein
MKAVKILVPFRFEIDGKAVEFEPGAEDELPKEAVQAFIDAGYVSFIEVKPAVKIVNKPATKVKAVK